MPQYDQVDNLQRMIQLLFPPFILIKVVEKKIHYPLVCEKNVSSDNHFNVLMSASAQ